MDTWCDVSHPLKLKRGALGNKRKGSHFSFVCFPFYLGERGEEEGIEASLFDPRSSTCQNSLS